MTSRATIEQGKATHVDAIIKLYRNGSGRTLDHGRLLGYISDLPSAIALKNEELVAFAFCLPFAPDIVELGNMFVAEDHRSLGIGLQLLQALEGQAKVKPRQQNLWVHFGSGSFPSW